MDEKNEQMFIPGPPHSGTPAHSGSCLWHSTKSEIHNTYRTLFLFFFKEEPPLKTIDTENAINASPQITTKYQVRTPAMFCQIVRC